MSWRILHFHCHIFFTLKFLPLKSIFRRYTRDFSWLPAKTRSNGSCVWPGHTILGSWQNFVYFSKQRKLGFHQIWTEVLSELQWTWSLARIELLPATLIFFFVSVRSFFGCFWKEMIEFLLILCVFRQGQITVSIGLYICAFVRGGVCFHWGMKVKVFCSYCALNSYSIISFSENGT